MRKFWFGFAWMLFLCVGLNMATDHPRIESVLLVMCWIGIAFDVAFSVNMKSNISQAYLRSSTLHLPSISAISVAAETGALPVMRFLPFALRAIFFTILIAYAGNPITAFFFVVAKMIAFTMLDKAVDFNASRSYATIEIGNFEDDFTRFLFREGFAAESEDIKKKLKTAYCEGRFH